MPIRTPLHEINELLRARCRAWSETPLPECGLRAIEISGDLLREILRQGNQRDLFDAIVACLPDDAAFIDLDERMIRMSLSNSGARDDYFMVVASSAWPPLEQAAVIPKLDIRLTRDWWRGQAASG